MWTQVATYFAWLFWPLPIVFLLAWAGERWPHLIDWVMPDEEQVTE